MPKLHIKLADDVRIKRQRLRMTGRNLRSERVAMNDFHLLWNGRPWLPSMGEFHFSRYPAELWDEELGKIKAGGVDIVATYVFWIHHEEEEGVFNFSGRRNLRRFIQLCGKHGLWVLMRIGPFCHGEVRNGGLPDWLYGRAFNLRQNDPRYLFYVKRLYRQIGKQLAGLMFKEGGPVIGLQCENEFMDSIAPWETTQNTVMAYTPKGADGLKHLMLLKRLARSVGIDAPIQTCTGWGASPIDSRHFLPMFGGYGYYSWIDNPGEQEPTSFFLFRDMHNRPSAKFDPRSVPYACCEIGGGIQVFYKNRPIVPLQSVEAMHIVQLGSGSNLMGYYVYHGGLNPVGERAYLNEHRCPRISYDFQAPLSEFGRMRPHYGMLRRQFLFLKAFGGRLAPMPVGITPEVAGAKPTDTHIVRWVVRSDGDAGFLFLNNFQDHVEMPDQKDLSFAIKLPGGETLKLPASGEKLTLKQGAACILPLNFAMDGLLLKSATVQPLTRLEIGDLVHYFFFAPRGMPAEYAFDTSSFAAVRLDRATRRDVGGLAIIEARPGTGSLLTFTLTGGKKVLVTTLSDEQSKEFYQATVAGRERVFLSNAQLLFKTASVELRYTDSPKASLAVYPAFTADSAAKKDGIFHRHQIEARSKSVKLAVRKVADGKFAVRISRNALTGVAEVYLRIDYIGDTASAYLDGKLIHDHFWNGSAWELALRPFAPRILREELVLVLTPLQGGPKVKCSSMAAMEVVSEGDTMEFRSIRAVVEYAAKLSGSRRQAP